MKSFASDNYSSVAPEILQAITDANQHHQPAYGNDIFTEEAKALSKENFGNDIDVFFVYNGTAANTAALKSVLRSHHAVICSDISHVATQEVGAVTNAIGCPSFLIPPKNGKISAEDIQKIYDQTTYWGQHGNLPKVVSIAQSTEVGTVYTIDELKSIAKVCKQNQLIFHMDGCRLANAAVSLNCSLSELTKAVGVDILSFGGTKNGLLFGEAIIFFNKQLGQEFLYIQKQSLQLHSKMRYLSAQFIPYLKNKLWYQFANHSNQMAKRLANGLSALNISFAYPVETNQLFVHFSDEMIQATQSIYSFYVWDKTKNLVRLVTSFDTTEAEVDHFLELCRANKNKEVDLISGK